jgi:hypothetical protein
MFALKTSKGRGTAIAATTALLAASFVGISGSAAQAAAASYVITPAYAQAANSTAVSVSLTGAGFKNAAGTTQVLTGALTAAATAGVQLATTCGTSLLTVSGSIQASGVGVTSWSVPTATRMTAYVKAVPGGTGGIKLAYKLCVYSSASGNPLLGSTTFTVYPKPTVTAVAPAGGPLQGGTAVTLVGTDFTKVSTVSVGASVAAAVAATNVKVVDATTITATVPAGAAVGAANVYVTNEGGISTTVGTYTFADTLTLTPRSAVTSTITTITVNGKGFNAQTWPASTAVAPAATIGAAGAWVILMAGNLAYTSSDSAAGDVFIDDQVSAYCLNVVVVSDTELTCEVPAIATAGAYRATLINNGLMGVADSGAAVVGLTQTTISSGSVFTVAAF